MNSYDSMGKKILKGAGLGMGIAAVSFMAYLILLRQYNKKRIKITGEKGIQENKCIKIGGVMHHFNIRGKNIENPVILFLHGGPGNPHAFINYHYQKYLEKDFTFVNWDQSGCGRTYYANKMKYRENRITTEELLEDLNEIVDYLRDRFQQDKIILIGHSWGSVLGSIYIQDFPEKIQAYIGLGQVIDPTGEEKAVAEAMKRADSDKNEAYIEQLGILFDDFEKARSLCDVDPDSFLRIRKIIAAYIPEKEVKGAGMLWMGLTSPDLNHLDLRWYFKVFMDTKDYSFVERYLFDTLFFKFDIWKRSRKYEMPVYYISGTSDWVTPFISVEEYFKEVEAPQKAFVFIENAGHNAHIDNPEAFANTILDLLKNNFKEKNK